MGWAVSGQRSRSLPLGDVACGGADSTGIWDVVGIAVDAVEADKGDGGGPEVTECSCQWGWGAG